MIHRAPLGSMERFIGVLIEHFAGAFPLWLAPEQVRVLTVSEKCEDYGREVEKQAAARPACASPATIGRKSSAPKSATAQLELIPYMFVVGPRDAESGTVSVRDRLEGDLGAMPIDAGHQPAARTKSSPAESARRTAASAGLEAKATGNEY